MPHNDLSKIRRLTLVIVCLLCVSQVYASTVSSAQPDIAEPAQSAATWSDPIPLSPVNQSVDSETPDIAVCSDGTVYVVWEQGDEIWYRVKIPFSGWNEASRVRFQEAAIPARGEEPTIAVSPDDCTLHLVWSDFWFNNDEIFYSANDGTGFLNKVRVSRTDEGQSRQSTITINSAGVPHVAWVDTVSDPPKLFESWPTPTSGDLWTKKSIRIPELVGWAQTPDLIADHNDQLHVTWMQARSRTSDIYYKRPEYWDDQIAKNISDSQNSLSRQPRITISHNQVIIVWQETIEGNDGSDDDEIFSTRRQLTDGDSEFVSTNNLSNSDANSQAPAVSTDDFGRFFVVWDEGSPTHAILMRVWSAGRGWSEDVQAISTGGATSVREPAIVASPEGDKAYAVWAQKDGPEDTWDIYFSEIELVTYQFYLTLIMNNYAQ